MFTFIGAIPPSKSLLNRWLCIESHAEPGTLVLGGDSRCDDVMRMREVVGDLQGALTRPEGERANYRFDCGAAGTVLRFFAFRASREPGEWRLTGSTRLLERPQAPLVDILAKLGVSVRSAGAELVISSQGWTSPGAPLVIDRSLSSQFLSGLFLNAWNLPFDLEVQGSGEAVSEGYFDLTLEALRHAGMTIEENAGESLTDASGAFLKRAQWRIPAGQRVKPGQIDLESDMSSAFAVAALAAVGGRATLRAFPEHSSQPDFVFVDILKRMGVEAKIEDFTLTVEKAPRLCGVEHDLRDCPDLFPVLATLCAFAYGTSRLTGAAHLVHKESNRLAEIESLLARLGRKTRRIEGGLEIEGYPDAPDEAVTLDPADDHRMVMAGAVARAAGARVEIQNAECVAKSFPEFMKIAGLHA